MMTLYYFTIHCRGRRAWQMSQYARAFAGRRFWLVESTFSSKLPKHSFTRIWNKTGSTLAHGKNRLTVKWLLKNSYLEAYQSQIHCINPRCTDCYDKWPTLGVRDVTPMITPWFNKFTLSVQINNFAHSYKSQYEFMTHPIITNSISSLTAEE